MGAAWMNGGKVRARSVHLLCPRAAASPETRLGLGQGQCHVSQGKGRGSGQWPESGWELGVMVWVQVGVEVARGLALAQQPARRFPLPAVVAC